MTDRCAISELPLGQCAGSCCVRPAPVRAVPIEWPRPSDGATPDRPMWAGLVAEHGLRPGWLSAEFRGQCRGCGEPFSRGALITRNRDTDGWISECCGEEEEW